MRGISLNVIQKSKLLNLLYFALLVDYDLGAVFNSPNRGHNIISHGGFRISSITTAP